MRLSIPERRLRRYAERFDVPEIDVRGRALRVRLRAGEAIASEAAGERQFGGVVHFDVDPATIAGRMLHTMERLCECAMSRADCDCCTECGSRGMVDAVACARCAGLGYVPRGL